MESKLDVLELLSSNLNDLNKICVGTADLRNVFDNISDSIYFDEGHVSDFGNELIAQKIFEVLKPVLSNHFKT